MPAVPYIGAGQRFRLIGWSLLLAIIAGLGLVPFCLFTTAVPLIIVTAGAPLTLLAAAMARGLANWHRGWAGRLLGEPVPRPYRQPPPEAGVIGRLMTILRDPATWRDWLWLLLNAVFGFALTLLAFVFFGGMLFYLIYPLLWSVTPQEAFGHPYGFLTINNLGEAFVVSWPVAVVFFALWWSSAPGLLRTHARLARSLLGPTEQTALRLRVQQLAESRADTVDTQAAELRRIERDLHDGAQARLVSLGMSLGLAEELLANDPEAARRLLAEARESTSTALSELRDLVRGIHPPVLADRGLDGAIRALALANPVTTDVAIDVPSRLPAPVESAAYFAIAEALANAIKHSGASKITLVVRHRDGLLDILVSDNGRGGADLSAGTGLRGIQRRLAAFDGTLAVDSPSGGPTDVRIALPCESSSPKTSPSSATA